MSETNNTTYTTNNTTSNTTLKGIYFGDRNEAFKTLIKSVLKKSKVKKSIQELLLTDESLTLYNSAFTSETADILNNYQVFEQLGDVSCNKALVSYFYTIFPFLNCADGVKVVARLRINYASKDCFSEIAEELGFWNFISASYSTRENNKKSLLEDVFEAFIGVTELLIDQYYSHKGLIGIGYACIYKIIVYIFEKKEISLAYSSLYDAKTRLKEIFDMYNSVLGTCIYEEEKNIQESESFTLVRIYNKKNEKRLLAESKGENKSDAEQKASELAISKLRSMGYEKKPPRFYTLISKKERVGFYDEKKKEEKESENECEKKEQLRKEKKEEILKTISEEKNINELYFTFGKSKYRNKNNYKSTMISHYCKMKDYIGIRECLKMGSDINILDTEGMSSVDYLMIGVLNDYNKKKIKNITKLIGDIEFVMNKNVYDNYYKKMGFDFNIRVI
jgi:dsRNA-specific ribonuclease